MEPHVKLFIRGFSMKKIIVIAALMVLLTGLAVSSLVQAQSRTGSAKQPAAEAAGGWSKHQDPMGFAVDLPPGWKISTDQQLGRITIRSPQAEQAIIWPMFLEKRQMDGRGASTVIQQLARKVDPAMPWSNPEAAGNAARVIGRTGQQSGVTLVTWINSPHGAALFLYCLEAPSAQYRASASTFEAILRSFHVQPNPSAAQAGAAPAGASAGGPVQYVRWSDPRENAFSVSIPQGWKVVGGAYRLSATDVRQSVTLLSPDSTMRIAVGDSNIGAYTAPTPMHYQLGFREGMTTALGDGSQLEIRRFMSGAQYARAYVERYVQPACGNLKIVSNNDRADLTQTFTQQALAEGMPANGQVSAGDIAFTCNASGQEAQGYYAIATGLPFPNQAPLWYVYRLYGFLAAPARAREAGSICQKVLESWKPNEQWKQQQKQIAEQAAYQDALRAQQVQRRALQAIHDDLQATSNMIVQGYNQRSQVYDEISRKRENAILGTVDVVDPTTNTQYKIDYNSDYHWMSDTGIIAGTQTGTSPGVGWRKMIDLP